MGSIHDQVRKTALTESFRSLNKTEEPTLRNCLKFVAIMSQPPKPSPRKSNTASAANASSASVAGSPDDTAAGAVAVDPPPRPTETTVIKDDDGQDEKGPTVPQPPILPTTRGEMIEQVAAELRRITNASQGLKLGTRPYKDLIVVGYLIGIPRMTKAVIETVSAAEGDGSTKPPKKTAKDVLEAEFQSFHWEKRPPEKRSREPPALVYNPELETRPRRQRGSRSEGNNSYSHEQRHQPTTGCKEPTRVVRSAVARSTTTAVNQENETRIPPMQEEKQQLPQQLDVVSPPTFLSVNRTSTTLKQPTVESSASSDSDKEDPVDCLRKIISIEEVLTVEKAAELLVQRRVVPFGRDLISFVRETFQRLHDAHVIVFDHETAFI